MLSDEQLQEWARQAAFSTMGEVREVLDRVVAETVEACAVVCDDKAEQYHLIFDDQDKARVSEECAAAIREKAREKK